MLKLSASVRHWYFLLLTQTIIQHWYFFCSQNSGIMASLSKYPCFCNSAGLERFESKTGRGFLKYKAGSCPLLIPEEKYPQLMDAFEMRTMNVINRITSHFVIVTRFLVCGCLNRRRIRVVPTFDDVTMKKMINVSFLSGLM